MRLKSVTVRNFRALADITVDLDDSTVLIGENNTGKTSFLEALKLCLSQGASRRGDVFDDYDHHLSSDQAQVGDAGDTEIVLRFGESTMGEWPAEVVQTLSEVISLDGDLQRVVLRVKSTKDAATGEMNPKWEFLDAAENPLKFKRPIGVVLRDLQQVSPFFYLSAVRDGAREFQPRSAFWGPFLRNPAITDELRRELETELDALNAKVIAADDKLKDVKTRLEKAGRIVSIGRNDAVAIEAVPGKARDLLSRAQVSVCGRSGASLPMTRHGAGTQSLAVLFLFEAFLNSMLERLYGADSSPLVAIEEPEAHLHPAAARALWFAISELPGQKLVATHSGDLLARVPLANVRRFCHNGSSITVRRLEPGTLSEDDARKISLHVRATRGELLFARSWLLVEGATEIWLFEGVAEVLGIDLEQQGVRLVQYAQVMPEPFIRLADDLGIGWYVFSDGDDEGKRKTKGVPSLLNGRDAAQHLQILSEPNVEVHLCNAGFGNVYLGEVAPQKQSGITANPTDSNYWEQVVKAVPNRGKEARAIKVIDELRKRGRSAVPPEMKGALERVVALGGGDCHGA